ncbi:alpha-L-rhamnosidase [Parabacteroides bouchesdurhonensis]|uniref:alpha-L-rhamnosidase n=1 Tax=Parabacteroides bouchesdurhonensis TaxID=1936995 RepID=UPI000E46E301|nr:alpha-L-rhamnosidase [Parabacteroides bouchesdurhonensis]RHJ91371.1 alpha-rhamnosidase [Bacteroides sp. AM07-16]
MKTKMTFILCLFLMLISCNNKTGISSLKCEMLTNPLGIDCLAPRLSWVITGEERGIKQQGYHILVASSLELLDKEQGDLWDSGDVVSDQSIQIVYAGKTLSSRQTCYWKVKVSTTKGESSWSEPAYWSMGLLDEKDWQAQWIGLDRAFEWDNPDAQYTRLSARYFRKEFMTEKQMKKATLYLSGLGLYKLYLNGDVIGDQELSPTPTDYSKSIKYNTFDVTGQLLNGENAIGVVLGNGRFFSMRRRDNYYPPGHHWLYNVRNFGFPKMILQLEIEYTDGEKQVIVSDNTWNVTADGPIRSNNEFDGEEYDATKEMAGWNQPRFNDSIWLQADLTESPGGKLEAQINPNIRIMETIKPIGIKEQASGKYIMDMGQNMVGWLQMRVKGQKGDCVTLRFSETLNPDGSLYMANIREAQVTDKYILKGGNEETWQPMFTYHGFRYVEITGYPGIPRLESFEGKVLYDEMETVGTFETSDSTINQIYKNAYWGIRGNYRGMPTDCPQRDERMGWLGDRATGSLGESFIFNNNNLYAKWLDDIEQAQLENGSIPDVAPNYWDAYNNNMTWPAAYIIIANMLYEQYGNAEPIAKHYASMKKWLDYMKENFMVDYLITRDTYGDWCLPPERPEIIFSEDPARKTDGLLIGTAFYYHLSNLMNGFATLLDKPEDAIYFSELSKNIRQAFNDKYLNKEVPQYSNNTVTANLMPLCYGMVPAEYEKEIFKQIGSKTENDFNGHVSTGLIGIQWLMRGLSEHGRADLAFRIATNRDYPSWGYMVENGATTIWELWNGNTADPAMNSGNHVMLLGDLVTWFYEYLAGIRNKQGCIGFSQIELKPYPVDGLNEVKASFLSPYGLIQSTWLKHGNDFQWDITIPCNTTARVCIPATTGDAITENNRNISEAEGIEFVGMEGEYAVFNVMSGSYHFVSSK